MKFKVGQRIKVIGVDNYFNNCRGKTGTIMLSNNHFTWPWDIKIDEPYGDTICAGEDEIELLILIGQQLLFGFMYED
jgi:hypothetical protein